MNNASISFGTKGAKYTIGTKREHITLGIPGTGLYFTRKLNPKNQRMQSEDKPVQSLKKCIQLQEHASINEENLYKITFNE